MDNFLAEIDNSSSVLALDNVHRDETPPLSTFSGGETILTNQINSTPDDEILLLPPTTDPSEDLLLVPQNAPEALNLSQNVDEVSRTSSKLGRDSLTGETDDLTIGEADTLTGGNTDEVEIETRARKKRDKAGNSMKKARNLGVLTDDEKFKEFVGKSGGKDFYKFRVKKKTDVDIELRGLSGNADLYLLNNKGKVIEKSAKGGKRAEDIERTLNPGSYYVRVQPKGKVNANYTLNLDTGSPDIAGNSLKKAHNLGVLKGDEKFQEFVGRSDRKDFYKFSVKKKTDVEIDLRELSGDADLYLLNNKGKVIEKSAKGGKRAEDIERTLNPGSYYVRVQPKGKANANYNLSLDTTSAKGSKLEYAPNEILVKLKSEPTVTQAQSMMASYGALAVQNLVQPDPNINSPVERWQLFKLKPGSDIEKLQRRLKKDSRVELAELNYQVSINSIPNDSSFGSLWGLNNTGSNGGTRDADIDAPEAWDTQKGSKNVVVAVVDTGVDYNHPDLAGNIWRNAGEIPGNFVDDDRNGFVDDVYGFDWVNGDGNPMDDNSHGTHVAGTIGAVGDNNRGVIGVSPNVSIMSLKFLGASDGGSIYGAAQAIIYAANMGADIINASYGGSGYDPVQEDAIDYANKKGVLFVASAGNSGTNNDGFAHYPSNYNLPNLLSVAATDNKDELAFFSNYGRNTVDIGAPGVGILSTVPSNKYDSYNGTSMATPHVAGAAALVLAENPNLGVTALKNTLLNNTDSIASLRGKTVTGGRLNVNKAIQAVSQPKKPDDFITVNSPNGGNTLEPGNSYTITWDDNISESVKLELYKGGSFNRTIGSSTESDGSYSWTVPTSITDGSDYKVKITSVNDTSVSDFSNSNFSIKANEPDGFITVNSPNGGNTLEPGNSYTITWNDNISENVKLELYKGGSFNRTINSSTESDGSYTWTMPASITDGSDYKVKITSLSDTSVSDFSNSNFSIKANEPDGSISRVLLADTFDDGNISHEPSISDDGRYIPFISLADNLVPGDTNGSYDVFVRDIKTGSNTRVSVASDGTQGNNDSSYDFSPPVLSSDGRYVAFSSDADNLVPGDTNGTEDVFLHDIKTGTTTRVSVSTNGIQSNGESDSPAISGDGRYVVFNSEASNLVPGDTNGEMDAFVHDTQTGSTTRVSVATKGIQGNSTSYSPTISDDGRYVAFVSWADNLVRGDTNSLMDVFVRDTQTGATNRVSVSSNGTQGNDRGYWSSISGDGSHVLFMSYSSNLVSGDTNGYQDYLNGNDVFVHNIKTGTTTRVSVSSNGTQGNAGSIPVGISRDGRYVAFNSEATNLVPGDTNGVDDIFLHDTLTGTTARVSVAQNGDQGNYNSGGDSISSDGRYLVFTSWADNLVPGDNNNEGDTFVYDRGF